jgi:hypothetical protein
MAEFNKSSGGGAWLDKKELKGGEIAKLVSEAVEAEGQNGPQIVAKIRIKGQEGEAKNVAINAPTKNALIDAFGKDSKNWTNQLLTVSIEKTLIAGKRGIALYLVPEGFEVTEDAGGYLVIARKGGAAPAAPGIEYPKDDINPDDIPF